MASALIYGGRANALVGEPGGGKTWVALHTCAVAMMNGTHVLYIDLEDHPASIVGRLKTLGVDAETLKARFHYVNPSKAMSEKARAYLAEKVRQHGIRLVAIDSIGELMSLQGIRSSNDDDAVAAVYRAIVRFFVLLGCAVVLLDHVPKNNEHAPLFGIGSQRKKAAIDGAMYMVETVRPFSAEHAGKLVLRTAKDRHGNFQVGSVAAEIDLTPGSGGDHLAITVKAPETAPGGQIRQTVNMSRVSKFLAEQADASANRAMIQKGTGIHDRNMTVVLGQLVDEGWAAKYSAGKGKEDRYCLIRPFDEMAETPASSDSWDTF